MLIILLRTHSLCAWSDSPDAAAESIFKKLQTIKFEAIYNPYNKIEGVKASRFVRQALRASLTRRCVKAPLVPQYVREEIFGKEKKEPQKNTSFMNRFRYKAVIKEKSYHVFDILTHLLHYKKGKVEGGYDTYEEAKKDGWTLECLDVLDAAILVHIRSDTELHDRINSPVLRQQLQELLGAYGTQTATQKKQEESEADDILSPSQEIKEDNDHEEDETSQNTSLAAGSLFAGALVASLLARNLSHIRENKRHLKVKKRSSKATKGLTSPISNARLNLSAISNPTL